MKAFIALLIMLLLFAGFFYVYLTDYSIYLIERKEVSEYITKYMWEARYKLGSKRFTLLEMNGPIYYTNNLTISDFTKENASIIDKTNVKIEKVYSTFPDLNGIVIDGVKWEVRKGLFGN